LENQRKKEITQEEIQAIEECLKRMSAKKEAPYFRHLLTELIQNQAIPIKLLEQIPIPPGESGKTRFDQLYDASMALVFPGYRAATLEKLFGGEEFKGGKIWRVLLPEKFKMVHVLIRAKNFQEAFAFGCDYACRASLRMFGSIPVDLTIRVVFMSERAIGRMLDLRWANRNNRRQKLKLVGRELTEKQINGARLIALGHPKDPKYSVAKYADKKDLDKVRKYKGLTRYSMIEHESYKRDSLIVDPPTESE
jgi:hypothetical protein